jgi:hypothetical protein
MGAIVTDKPPIWTKIFVGAELVHSEYAFATRPTIGLQFHTVGEADAFEIESVEPDPGFPGRFIVHAKRLG